MLLDGIMAVHDMSKTSDLQKQVTDRIIAEIERGGLSWLKGWTETGLPVNGVSKRAYRGINTLWLMLEIKAKGYRSNRFYTFNQVKALKGHVNPGTKGTHVFFYKLLVKEIEDRETGELKTVRIPLMRAFTVFNGDQTTLTDKDMADMAVKAPVDTIQACEEIAGWSDCPEVIIAAGAYYTPSTDKIGMPAKDAFSSAEPYYATLFHEMVHSTGSKNRLNRPGIIGRCAFGSDQYSVEEVIAELGSAVLCAQAGVFDAVARNDSAYIEHWLARLRKDSRFIFKVMGDAQKAVDMITGEAA